MTENNLKFYLGGEVTIDHLSDALSRFSQVLDALRLSHGAEVRWMLTGLDYGSAAATAQAVPLNDEAAERIPHLYDSCIDAARRVLDGRLDRSLALHREMHGLMALVDESHSIAIEADGEQVVVKTPIDPLTLTAAEAPDVDATSLGTVRGLVETLSRRRGLNFRLYDLVTDSAVVCHMEPDLEDAMRGVWGRVADVTGTVHRDPRTDRPLSIRRVTNLDPVDEGDPSGYLKARGAIHPSEPAEVLVRRMRDEC